MPRRDAQVHRTLSRLLRNSPRGPPVWYAAMLAYPPSPLPPRRPGAAQRTSFDLPAHTTPAQRVDPRPLEIQYPEDQIRQQFFRDHPFEAFRPRSLVEDREVGAREEVDGSEWVRLRQRARNPSSEDCIAFALNLHLTHSHPLSDAYTTAISQFRTLRSEHTISTSFALAEAEAYGAHFDAPTELQRAHAHKELHLAKHARLEREKEEESARAAKRWRIDPVRDNRRWTAGVEYMERLRKGGGPISVREVTRPGQEDRERRTREEREMLGRAGRSGTWEQGAPTRGRYEDSRSGGGSGGGSGGWM